MPAWQVLGAAGFPAFFLLYRGWQGVSRLRLVLRVWPAWLALALGLAFFGTYVAQSLDRGNLGAWTAFSFQARFWMLASFPGLALLAKAWVQDAPFQPAFAAGLWGLALAPFVSAAYGRDQAFGMLAAFVPLMIARLTLGLDWQSLRPASGFCAAHGVVLLHASELFPGLLTKALLLLALAFVPGPSSIASGALGLAGGALVLAAKKAWAPNSAALYWQFAVASGIALGWLFKEVMAKKREEHAAAA